MQKSIMTLQSACLKHAFLLISGLIIGSGTSVCQSDENLSQEAMTPSSEFKYNDDWALVSAPPPPGPYQSINVDPRVPGQEDNLPPPPTDLGIHPSTSAKHTPGNLMKLPPPAAGGPGEPPMPYGKPSWEVPPYNYSRSPAYPAPRRGWQAGSVPGQDYYRMPPSPNRDYREPVHDVPPWYSTSPATAEEEVPPPPVYDRMTPPYHQRQYFRDGVR